MHRETEEILLKQRNKVKIFSQQRIDLKHLNEETSYPIYKEREREREMERECGDNFFSLYLNSFQFVALFLGFAR